MEVIERNTPTFFRNPDGSFPDNTMREIEQELYKLTDEYSKEQSPLEHRNHLGASVIGEACSRKLWYSFRWVKLEQFEGRMRRLFRRGNDEENKLTNILLWMGFYMRDIDPETDKQYNFSTIGGHYGGSSDSLALLPWFREEKDRILAEYKTHNTKWFKKLKEDKLKITKPLHFIQMSAYGKAFKVKYGLYCAVNKDDDDIYYEFLELDWNLAASMEAKAYEIITSQTPPNRISDNPAYHECKWCNFFGICHNQEPVEINCRSCKMAVPVPEGGKWYCNRYQNEIPKDWLKEGCGLHVPITN